MLCTWDGFFFLLLLVLIARFISDYVGEKLEQRRNKQIWFDQHDADGFVMFVIERTLFAIWSRSTYTAAVATINSFVLSDCVWPQIVEYTARWIVCHFSFFFVRCSFRVFPFYIQCTVYSLISSNKHALYRDFSCWSFHWIGWRTTTASV